MAALRPANPPDAKRPTLATASNRSRLPPRLLCRLQDRPSSPHFVCHRVGRQRRNALPPSRRPHGFLASRPRTAPRSLRHGWNPELRAARPSSRAALSRCQSRHSGYAPSDSLSLDQSPFGRGAGTWCSSPSRRRSIVSSSEKLSGVQSCSLTCRSPIELELILGRPRPRKLKTCPLWVPAGICSVTVPLTIGTSTFAPIASCG